MNNFIESKFKATGQYILVLPALFFLLWIVVIPADAKGNHFTTSCELPIGLSSSLADTAKLWQATINKDTLHVEFDYLSPGIDQSSTWFLIKQFAGLNQTTGHNFFVTCDAGSVYFNGVLQKGEGHGRYKFIPHKDYAALLKKVCSESVNDHALFTLMIFHVTSEYLEKLNNNGVNDMTIDNIIWYFTTS